MARTVTTKLDLTKVFGLSVPFEDVMKEIIRMHKSGEHVLPEPLTVDDITEDLKAVAYKMKARQDYEQTVDKYLTEDNTGTGNT